MLKCSTTEAQVEYLAEISLMGSELTVCNSHWLYLTKKTGSNTMECIEFILYEFNLFIYA